MRIGLLGGTFNPIHNGHLHIAEEVMHSCGLEQVWFIPSCRPPHKELAHEVCFARRLAMVDLALASWPHFRSCSIEGERGGTSYTVETLRQLRQRHPADEFFFIMGLDSFQDLALWKEYQRLFDYAHIVVTARPGFEGTLSALLPVAMEERFCYDPGSKKLLCDSGFSLFLVDHTQADVSSTEVRRQLAAGDYEKAQVPPAVRQYCREHRLYR